MFAADPDFAMGTIMTNTMELFGVPPSQAEQPRQRLINLSTSSQAATLTQLEKYHLEAGLLLSQEDYKVGGLDFTMTLVFILYCFYVTRGQWTGSRTFSGSIPETRTLFRWRISSP